MATSLAQPLDPVNAWLIAQYKVAAQRMRDMILSPTGKTAAAQAFRQGRAAEMFGQINQIRADLRGAVATAVPKMLRPAYQTGITSAIQQATDAGIRPAGELLQGSFSLIDRRAVEAIAKATFADLTQAADSIAESGRRVIRSTQQHNLAEAEVNKIIAGNIIDGTPALAQRRLRDELRRVNDGNLVEVNGSHYDAGYYARMVVITKTREAVEEGRHERFREMGEDLVMIIGRVSDNPCSAFLGQVFSLSGKSDKYPPYSSLPDGGAPFHPHCSKSTRLFVESMATPEQLAAAQPTPDTDQMLARDKSGNYSTRSGDRVKFAEAGRIYKDLQIRSQAEQRYNASIRSILKAA